LPEIWAMPMSHPDYRASWSVPVDWKDISGEWPKPTPETLLWNAWANEENAVALLTASSSQVANGLMVLTIQVEPLDPASSSNGVETVTGRGQSVWFEEIADDEAAPFDLRLVFSIAQPPYTYSFSMNCLLPKGNDTFHQESFAALCRHFWDFVSYDFGVCTAQVIDNSDLSAWQTVRNGWYKYAFEVPETWLRPEQSTADQFSFYSDPHVYGQPNLCPMSNGLMKLDFSAQPPGNYEPGGPDLEGFTAITVAEHPAWIKTVEGGEAMDPLATSTAVYIQGDEFWYFLGLGCIPPTGADAEDQSRFKAACAERMEHILNSFQIFP
jgi:hypothetical protein